MNDLFIALIILLIAIAICVIVYYEKVIKPVRREQKNKMFFNAWTGSWDNKEPKRKIKIPKKLKPIQ